MNQLIKNLQKILGAAAGKNTCEGLLFSGGLDSAILAGLRPQITAVTVSLGADAGDLPYAKYLAKAIDIKKHVIRQVEIDEAIDKIPAVIRILKSFDPAIPNDLAVYFGLEKAKDLGINKAATGDGSDELFAGYSFMKDIDDLQSYIKRIAKKMYFSSNEIGEFFGIKIIQPFIDKNLKKFALQIPCNLKIKKNHGKIWGKWILRKAFEDILPEKSVWQGKRPLEYGSGMRKLRRIISNKISKEEFQTDSPSIKFISREHFYYYKIYRKVVGKIPAPMSNEKACSGCGAGMLIDSFHCRICGYVLSSQNICKKGGDKR